MEQDRKKAWGFSLFGDDLRQEAGGKISLMGLYQEDMVFQGEMTLPLVAPKFVIFICYYELKGALQEDITFRVTQGREDNVLAEVQFKRKDLPPPKEIEATDGEKPEDVESIFHARIPVILSPFVIETFGRVRVRAHYSDDTVLKLGSLNIRSMSPKQIQELLARNAEELAKSKVI